MNIFGRIYWPEIHGSTNKYRVSVTRYKWSNRQHQNRLYIYALLYMAIERCVREDYIGGGEECSKKSQHKSHAD